MNHCKISVPDQIGTLSQVGTNAKSFNMAQKVLTWSNSQLNNSRCNFTFHVLLFIFRLVHVFSQNLLQL